MSNPLVLTVLPNPSEDSSGHVHDSFEHVLSVSRRAEEVGLDAVFLADSLAFDISFSRNNRFEPLTLAGALLSRTERIHLIVTISTTFTHPYNVARYLTSLAHIGNGRIGANLVTSFDGERNFGLRDLPDPDERYSRAEDYIDVMRQLWASWGPDRGEGTEIQISTKHFDVGGPLSNKPYPDDLLVGQSGSSPPGIALAARQADFVFTAAPADHVLRQYFGALTNSCEEHRADGLRPTVLCGLAPIIGDSHEQALESEQALYGAFSFAEQRRRLEDVLGIDLSDVDPRDSFPSHRLLPIEQVIRRQGRAATIYEIIEKNKLTLAEVVRTQNTSNGHRTVVGSPDEVAREVARIADTSLVDGFIILLPKITELAERVFEDLFPRLERLGYLNPARDANATRSRFLRRSSS